MDSSSTHQYVVPLDVDGALHRVMSRIDDVLFMRYSFCSYEVYCMLLHCVMPSSMLDTFPVHKHDVSWKSSTN